MNQKTDATDMHGKPISIGDEVDLIGYEYAQSPGKVVKRAGCGYLIVETEDGQRWYPYPEEVVKIIGG